MKKSVIHTRAHSRGPVPDPGLLDAIEALYASVLDPRGFAGAPDRIAGAVDARTVNMWCITTELDVVQGHNHGMAPEVMETYLNEWFEHDVVHRTALREGLGRCFTAEDLLGDAYERLPVYEGFYRPSGIGQQLGHFDRAGRAWLSSISIQRPHTEQPFSEEERQRVECLGRHFNQAMKLALRLETASGLASSLETSLDRCHLAVFVCDPDGRLLWANADGERRLQQPGIVVDLRSRRIRFVDNGANRQLRSGFRAVADGRAAPVDILVDASGGMDGECCTLFPVMPAADHTLGGQPLVALVLRDLDAPISIEPGRPVGRLGITPAEADVLADLMSGRDLPAIAEERGCALSTIRSYVKSLLQRLDCHTQAELVTKGWSSLAIIPEPGMHGSS